MSDPRPPDDGDHWPKHDLRGEAEQHEAEQRDAEGQDAGQPDVEPRAGESASSDATAQPHPVEPDETPVEPDEAPVDLVAADPPTTSATGGRTIYTGSGDGWDPKRHGDRRRPTTAEQAVPWLIGLILALAGMVVLLIALILSGPDALIGSTPSTSPTPAPSLAASSAPEPTPVPTLEPAPTGSPTDEPTPVATPSPLPTYGPLEMVYLGRQTTTAPIYLLRREFSTSAEATVMAQASGGVGHFAWAADGSRGAAIVGGSAVAVVPGQPPRALADQISALTFSWDSETVYAVRVVRDGASDRADVLSIDFASGGTQLLTGISYPHPATAPDAALREAQFIDDGGLVRIYATNDGNVVVWVLGAPQVYRVDPADGSVREAPREPVLWSPDGRYHVTLAENANGTTVIGKRNRDGDAEAAVTVSGLVSHIRWAPTRNEIVFTLGQSTSSGGVRQDLYVWDLIDGKAPAALTSNGAAFGAEWLGVAQSWQP